MSGQSADGRILLRAGSHSRPWVRTGHRPEPLPATRQSIATAHPAGCDGRAQQQGSGAMTSAAKPKLPLPTDESRAYPVLPLRDIVVFPHMIVPLFVGREKSIKALEEVMRSDTFILLATQKNASDDDPATDAIYT